MSFRAARSFFKTAFLVTLPAAISLWLSYRLFHMGMTEKSLVAWVVLFLASPFTILFTFLALAFNGLSMLAALFYFFGRRSAQFRVFTNLGSMEDMFIRREPPRDVTPTGPKDVTPRHMHLLKETDFER